MLAVLSALGGWILGPATALDPAIWVFKIISPEQGNAFVRFLEPALSLAHHEISMGEERMLAVQSVLVASVGIALAALLYVWRPALPARIRAALGPIHSSSRTSTTSTSSTTR